MGRNSTLYGGLNIGAALQYGGVLRDAPLAGPMTRHRRSSDFLGSAEWKFKQTVANNASISGNAINFLGGSSILPSDNGSPRFVAFSEDGTHIIIAWTYVSGSFSRAAAYTFSLATPFTPTTNDFSSSLATKHYSASTGFTFASFGAGGRYTIVANGGLSTDFEVYDNDGGTAYGFSGIPVGYNKPAGVGNITSMNFAQDGKKAVFSDTNSRITVVNLSTPYDFSTMSSSNFSQHVIDDEFGLAGDIILNSAQMSNDGYYIIAVTDHNSNDNPVKVVTFKLSEPYNPSSSTIVQSNMFDPPNSTIGYDTKLTFSKDGTNIYTWTLAGANQLTPRIYHFVQGSATGY
jgi:hypothetical protein